MDLLKKPAQPSNDDAELAKVLEGMTGSNDSGMSFEETPTQAVQNDDNALQPNGDSDTPAPDLTAQVSEEPVIAPVAEEAPAPEAEATPAVPSIIESQLSTPSSDASLGDIKKNAISELRPLIDKLELPANEKFDTLLLLIRSTDDQSLITTAFEAAKAIPDETKRAEALLDVIKEIDFFSNASQNA